MAAPNVQLTGGGVAVAAGIAVGGLALWWASRKAGAAVGAVTEAAGDALWAISPTNNENVIYGAVNTPIQWLTGDPNATLGGVVYDVTTDGTLNPASPNNWVYRNIKIEGQTLGGWLYDVFNN